MKEKRVNWNSHKETPFWYYVTHDQNWEKQTNASSNILETNIIPLLNYKLFIHSI